MTEDTIETADVQDAPTPVKTYRDYDKEHREREKRRLAKARSEYYNIAFNKELGMYVVQQISTETNDVVANIGAFADVLEARMLQSRRNQGAHTPYGGDFEVAY